MVSARYPPFVGGTEVHVEQVARRLVARGVEVTVLTTDVTGDLPAAEEVDGLHVRRVRARPRRRDYYFAPRIYTEIVRGDWDLVHVQGFQTFVAPLAMLAALRLRTPYLVTFHAGGHSSRWRKGIGVVQRHLLRPLLRRANVLIALSSAEAEKRRRELRIPAERFAIVPNGSDLPRSARALPERRDGALIASVGRLERYKGHHRVIEAMPHVLERRPDARLWIGGAGPYEATLARLAERLGVSEHVEIRAIPIDERTRMAEELSRVKVVVCLSDFESQPIAPLEALCCGCRLVVADAPGLDELAEQGLASAVSLDSTPPEVATVVLRELELPPNSTRPSLPTWDECAAALLELYEMVADRGVGVRAGPARDSAASTPHG